MTMPSPTPPVDPGDVVRVTIAEPSRWPPDFTKEVHGKLGVVLEVAKDGFLVRLDDARCVGLQREELAVVRRAEDMRPKIADMLVYVAGPLFSDSERQVVRQIAEIAEYIGFPTFLPHRDAGLQQGHEDAEKIFRADVAALDRATLVVANLDGCDVDSGTAWEIGYAFAKKKRILGVRTDRRVLEPFSPVNLMIERSVAPIARTLVGLEHALLFERSVLYDACLATEDRNP